MLNTITYNIVNFPFSGYLTQLDYHDRFWHFKKFRQPSMSTFYYNNSFFQNTFSIWNNQPEGCSECQHIGAYVRREFFQYLSGIKNYSKVDSSLTGILWYADYAINSALVNFVWYCILHGITCYWYWNKTLTWVIYMYYGFSNTREENWVVLFWLNFANFNGCALVLLRPCVERCFTLYI